MNADTVIVEQIRELRNLATPLPEIASRLQLPDELVRHVLQYGTLTEAHPLWSQPSNESVSDK